MKNMLVKIQELKERRKNVERKRAIDRETVTAGEIRQYAYCPRKIYYYRVMGLKRVASTKMQYGRGVHKELSRRRNAGTTENRYHDVFVYDDDLGIIGYIDEIRWFGDEPKLVEYKTGDAPEVGTRYPDLLQLAALCMMAEEVYGIQIERAIVHYLKTNEKREIHIGIRERLKVLEIVEKIRKMLETEEFPEVQKGPQCRDCEFLRRCWWEY